MAASEVRQLRAIGDTAGRCWSAAAGGMARSNPTSGGNSRRQGQLVNCQIATPAGGGGQDGLPAAKVRIVEDRSVREILRRRRQGHRRKSTGTFSGPERGSRGGSWSRSSSGGRPAGAGHPVRGQIAAGAVAAAVHIAIAAMLHGPRLDGRIVVVRPRSTRPAMTAATPSRLNHR